MIFPKSNERENMRRAQKKKKKKKKERALAHDKHFPSAITVWSVWHCWEFRVAH
jgi:hypothetical protein